MHNTVLAFNRDSLIKKLNEISTWDIIVIGGGATGLGTALDAASRGFKTLLIEQADFAKGTSSRSTKLVHGGVRYLAQGNIALVREALKERGLLLENVPHLIKKQIFIIPCYSCYAKIKYLIGLKLYDWLSGKWSFGKSKALSKESVMKLMPNLEFTNLKGGVEYYDGQFDDARLAIDIAKTCINYNGVVINYIKAIGLTKDGTGRMNGVLVNDLESGIQYNLKTKVVINATGVFVDDILHMDYPEGKPLTRPSQGVHLVLDPSFWNSDAALMIPKTSDGRVLFAVPWYNHLLLGTTDTPLNKHSLEPIALESEIKFILNTATKYLNKRPERKDVLTVFAGLRPLAAPADNVNTTKEISRSHKIYQSKSGLITITGGKWTTYRKMAEDAINRAIKVGDLDKRNCQTYHLKISNKLGEISIEERAKYSEKALLPPFTITEIDVIKAARFEMARTVEDILARRFRILFLDAHAAILLAPMIAPILAKELDKDENWQRNQVIEFKNLAQAYLIEYYN